MASITITVDDEHEQEIRGRIARMLDDFDHEKNKKRDIERVLAMTDAELDEWGRRECSGYTIGRVGWYRHVPMNMRFFNPFDVSNDDRAPCIMRGSVQGMRMLSDSHANIQRDMWRTYLRLMKPTWLVREDAADVVRRIHLRVLNKFGRTPYEVDTSLTGENALTFSRMFDDETVLVIIKGEHKEITRAKWRHMMSIRKVIDKTHELDNKVRKMRSQT